MARIFSNLKKMFLAVPVRRFNGILYERVKESKDKEVIRRAAQHVRDQGYRFKVTKAKGKYALWVRFKELAQYDKFKELGR